MLSLLLSLTTPALAGPPDQAAKMIQVAHVSPMPPYMSIVKAHADELALTAEQQKGLESWQAGHKGPFLALVAEVLRLEGEIGELSRSGETAKVLMQKLDEVHEVRVEAAKTKVACRDNLQTILSEKQWKQVAEWSRAGLP